MNISRVWNRLVPNRLRPMLVPLASYRRSWEGLPPGIEHGFVDETCRAAFGKAAKSIRTTPLYTYKAEGTYRLFITLTQSYPRTMILKNARLTPDTFPAIDGFPGAVGEPEWQVLSGAVKTVGDYLPRVYAAVEVEAGRHYRYLLEDLAWNRARVRTNDQILEALHHHQQLLSALNQGAAEGPPPQSWLVHDHTNGQGFLMYVQEALSRFDVNEHESAVARLLGGWQELSDKYVSIPAELSVPSKLVHGDYNGQNLFLAHRSDDFRVIDWEWAGWGPPHIDLASLLKYTSSDFQQAAVQRYFADDPTTDPQGHWRLFMWARLARALLDAALHAKQNVSELGHTADSVAHHAAIAEDAILQLT